MIAPSLQIDPCEFPPECALLRQEVRLFLANTLKDQSAELRAKGWTAIDRAFSLKLGERGWIGMTWPARFGGHERSPLERYVVLEELLAAGAPVCAHWVAERQSGALLMRYAADTLAPWIVPRIVRGELIFCIGMSEPDSGSDLASIRSRAEHDGEAWVLNGRKVWTSGAHQADYMIALMRTRPRSENRHDGMSQFLVDMNAPGITVRPIYNLLGEHEFNEVVLDEVRVPNECLIGSEGDGWRQVTAELAFERSGPERYLSSTSLLLGMLDMADSSNERHTVALGRVVARYAALRQMSLGVSGMLMRGQDPALVASLVKDQGALVEQSIPDIAHDLFSDRRRAGTSFATVESYISRAAPSFSLRGGTREILRGIIARGLGLR